MSGLEASRQFWDEKARENPYWYVSSAGPYEGRNLAEFWASGPKIWNDLKSASGYQPKRIDTVVEIGCGVGRLTRAIAPEVGRVFAFDLSAEMHSGGPQFCYGCLRLAESSGIPRGHLFFPVFRRENRQT